MTERPTPMSTDATMPLESNRKGRTRAYTPQGVLSDIMALYARLNSLRKVANHYGVNHAVIQRALQGHEPENPHARAALGLPPLMLAPACLACGEVHVSPRCPKKGKRPRPRRVAISAENMESAAGTILRNLAGEKIRQLIAILEANGDDEK